MGVLGRMPKPASERHNRNPRQEIGLVERPREGEGGAVVSFVPRAPAGLSAAGKRRWRAFWQSPVAKVVDQQADAHGIERWIWATEEWDTVSAVLRKQRIVRGSQGQPVLNPLASYLAQLAREIEHAEQQMGLTPAARLRLGIVYGEAKLTALELNRQLEAQAARGRDAGEAGDLDVEWEAV